MQIVEDIRPLADLENNYGEILKQLRETGRPIVLTVKGKADAVLMGAKTYEKHLRAANLSRLLAPAEADVAAGRVRSRPAPFRDRCFATRRRAARGAG